MTFFSLISTAFSSIFYGIIVTAVMMVLLYVLLRSISKDVVQTPVFHITGVVLAVLLVIQTSLMIGAMQAMDATDAAELYVNQMLENASGIVEVNNRQHILDAVNEEFPLIGTYLGNMDFSDIDISKLPSAMHDTVTSFLRSYVWHRVWWTLGIIVVSVVTVILFGKNGYTTNHQQTRRRVAFASESPHHRNRRRVH